MQYTVETNPETFEYCLIKVRPNSSEGDQIDIARVRPIGLRDVFSNENVCHNAIHFYPGVSGILEN